MDDGRTALEPDPRMPDLQTSEDSNQANALPAEGTSAPGRDHGDNLTDTTAAAQTEMGDRTGTSDGPEMKDGDAGKAVPPLPFPLQALVAGMDSGPDTEKDGGTPSTRGKKKKRKYRAVFVSDTHLGTRAARVDLFLDFLKSVECEQLYLVGDIIDGWRLKKSWYWDTTHNDAIRRVLKMAKTGTKVVYIPGNHDEGFRDFTGHNMAGVTMVMDAIFESATGKKYWVLHGDEFDGVVLYAKWLAYVGDWAYTTLLKINTGFNWVRRKMGYSYWSLSAYLKHKVKNAVEFIGHFEDAVAAEAARRGVDGVICGHIHHAERRMIGNVEYLNDGDWVESCTALVEHDDGTWEILYWADEVAARMEKAQNYKRRKKARRKMKAPSQTPVAAE